MTTLPARLRRAPRAFGRGIHDFFYGRIPALPFGLLRIGWSLAALWSMILQWPRLTTYYSNEGVFLPQWETIFARTEYRYTLLSYVHDPLAVHALFALMIFALLCMLVGIWTRFMTVASIVLIYSFQEHSFGVYAGGDTVVRVVGFIIAIAPSIEAMSFDRYLRQQHSWLEQGKLLPPLTMPRWPKMMLTWQFVLLYCTAAWYKLLDPMWRNGSATVISMMQLEFTRFPLEVNRLFGYISKPASWGTIFWQLAWLLLLVPKRLRLMLPKPLQGFRRWIFCGGIAFHLMILVFMDAGIFSYIMMLSYLGLLESDDFAYLRTRLNRRWKGSITVLFDGTCHFCRRSVLPLMLGDWLERLEIVDFHDEAARTRKAPHISLKALDEALHIVLPDGQTYAGFDAFRVLCRHLPGFWPLVPLLHLPGVAPVGRKIYAQIAGRRTCLAGGECRIHRKATA